MDGLLVAVAGIVLVAYAVAQARCLARWRGVRRWAAAVPLAGVAFVVARIALDLREDPTSHNLWPFEVLVAAGTGLAALALLHITSRAIRSGGRA